MRRGILLRRCGDEIVTPDYARCEGGNEADGEGARGEEVEGCWGVGERVGGVDGCGVWGFGERVCRIGDEGFRVGWGEEVWRASLVEGLVRVGGIADGCGYRIYVLRVLSAEVVRRVVPSGDLSKR